MTTTDAKRPHRIWALHTPFNKQGVPVMGTFGKEIRAVVVMKLETWQELCREIPQLAATKFEVGTFDEDE